MRGKMNDYDKVWKGYFDWQALYETEECRSLLYFDEKQRTNHMNTALKLLSRFGPRERLVLLDAGCGTGSYVERLVKVDSHNDVFGLDISHNILCRGLRTNTVLEGRVFQGSIDSLPFSSKSFNVVMSIGVLQTVAAPDIALCELCRVIRPGGTLIISTLRKHSIWELPFLFWLLSKKYIEQTCISGEILAMVKSRENLNWRKIPNGFPPKKYSYNYIKKLLVEAKMEGIRCFYPEKPYRLPILMNSFHMFIVCRKSTE